MGLTTWDNAPKGKILKKDVTIAKNYLTKQEISELNTIVNMYLDYAELQARRQKTMTMRDWVEKLDAFLKFNEYDILSNAGTVRSEVAKSIAEKEFEKFRVIQDSNYESDFDSVIKEAMENQKVPNEDELFPNAQPKTNFDKTLEGLLAVPPPPKKKP